MTRHVTCTVTPACLFQSPEIRVGVIELEARDLIVKIELTAATLDVAVSDGQAW